MTKLDDVQIEWTEHTEGGFAPFTAQADLGHGWTAQITRRELLSGRSYWRLGVWGANEKDILERPRLYQLDTPSLKEAKEQCRLWLWAQLVEQQRA